MISKIQGPSLTFGTLKIGQDKNTKRILDRIVNNNPDTLQALGDAFDRINTASGKDKVFLTGIWGDGLIHHLCVRFGGREVGPKIVPVSAKSEDLKEFADITVHGIEELRSKSKAARSIKDLMKLYK